MTNFFADDPDEGIQRDRYGRPLIFQENGTVKPYRRASSVAGTMNDAEGIVIWSNRHTAVGVARNVGIAQRIATLGENPDDYTPQDKRDLDSMIRDAKAQTGGEYKADYGTALHRATEPGFDGIVIGDGMRADIGAYESKMLDLGLVAIATEIWLVSHRYEVAGTADHLYLATKPIPMPDMMPHLRDIAVGDVLIGDKKTGRYHPGQVAIQLALYSDGVIDLPEGALDGVNLYNFRPDLGLGVHIPRGEQSCSVYPVDLLWGADMVRLCNDVAEFRRSDARKQRSL